MTTIIDFRPVAKCDIHDMQLTIWSISGNYSLHGICYVSISKCPVDDGCTTENYVIEMTQVKGE